MIICSCTRISDHDIELALLEIMIQENAPLPTPGVIWRHLNKKMNCCGCAPLAVETIYSKLEALESRGLLSPCLCATVKSRWRHLEKLRAEARSAAGMDDMVTFSELAEADV